MTYLNLSYTLNVMTSDVEALNFLHARKTLEISVTSTQILDMQTPFNWK